MLEMNPALVIGAGGTGNEVIMHVRKKIVQRFGSLKAFPLLGYLHLDTAHSQESQAMPSTQYLGEDIALVESERLVLTVTGGNSWKNNQAIRAWFPDDLPIPPNFRTGCAAQRNYGRLAFSANVDAIRDHIVTLVSRIADSKICEDFSTSQQITVAKHKLDVFIVGSLLGGTGGGMLFDLCYVTRHGLEGRNTSFYGYFITGGPTTADDHKANCYAALQELDYYNQREFQMQYPGANVREIKSDDKPVVDWLYLVNGINAMGVPFPPALVWESVAEHICAELLPGFKDRRQLVRDNIRDAGYGELDRLGKPQRYLSFGMASIEFPSLNLQDALSYRLAAHTLRHWSFAHAPQEDHVKLVDTDIAAWRLNPDQLEEDLLKDAAGISQIQQINARTAEQRADAESLLDRTRRDDLKLKMETHLLNNDADVEKRAALTQSGARIQQLDQRRHRLLQEITHNRLYPRLLALITNEQSGGVRNARGYLDALEQRLRQHAGDHQKREDRYRQEASRAYDEKQKRLQVFYEEPQEGKFVVQRHVAALCVASARYQQAQVRFTANERARVLLTGRQRATGEWQERGLLAEVSDLRTKLGRYEEVLQELSKRSDEQYERRAASLASSEGLADVMITPEEIEDIYGEAVRDPLQTTITLKAAVEATQGRNLFSAILDTPEQTLDALVRAVKEHFAGVREISIAERLTRLSPTERDRKIQTANRNAHVLIQADTERRQRYAYISAPEHTQSLLIGTASPDVEPTLAVGGPLRQAIERQVAIIRDNFVQALSDRSRLLLGYEMGVFSLHCVRDFADYRKIYRDPQAQRRHRQTHKGIAFPDLFPPEEAELSTRAERAAVLGRALGLFTVERDPETHDPAIYYYYVDRHGRHPVQLGQDWQAVEERLFVNQKEKDILANSDRNEMTPLERLEGDLRQKGKQAVTRSQKEELWIRLQTFLDQREAELDGGLRHVRHQVENSHINAYRDTYDLTPPVDWSSRGREGAPPLRQRSTGPLLPSSARAGDIEGFRHHVKQRVTDGGLTGDQQAALFADAADFDLGYDEAEQVIQEVERTLVSSGSLNETMQRYLEEYQRLWERSGGKLTAQQLAYLQGVKKKLELTAEQTRVVEALIGAGGNPQ